MAATPTTTDPTATGYPVPTWRIQLVREGTTYLEQKQVRCPADAAAAVGSYIGEPDRECMVVLMLSTKNHVITGMNLAFQGSLNSAQVRLADVFKPAILANAAAVVIAHNHPSGDPSPSRDDIEVTRHIVQAGKLLDIDVLDHIILGQYTGPSGQGYISLKERGLMD